MALAIIAFRSQSGLLDTARGRDKLFPSFTWKHRDRRIRSLDHPPGDSIPIAPNRLRAVQHTGFLALRSRQQTTVANAATGGRDRKAKKPLLYGELYITANCSLSNVIPRFTGTGHSSPLAGVALSDENSLAPRTSAKAFGELWARNWGKLMGIFRLLIDPPAFRSADIEDTAPKTDLTGTCNR
jgi:hypothetical protein